VGIRTSTRWALLVFGVLGALFTLTLLPLVFGAITRDPMVGLPFVEARFPLWARWQNSPNSYAFIVAGGLGALLFVAGRRNTRVFSVIFLATLVACSWTLRSRGYWQLWMAEHARLTPFAIVVCVLFTGYLVATVLAFVRARQLREGSLSN
jgi:hypothetical protein